MDTQLRELQSLLAPREVAALLFVDPKTVTRWAQAGKLNSFRTPGGHRRYLKSDILALVSGIADSSDDNPASFAGYRSALSAPAPVVHEATPRVRPREVATTGESARPANARTARKYAFEAMLTRPPTCQTTYKCRAPRTSSKFRRCRP